MPHRLLIGRICAILAVLGAASPAEVVVGDGSVLDRQRVHVSATGSLVRRHTPRKSSAESPGDDYAARASAAASRAEAAATRAEVLADELSVATATAEQKHRRSGGSEIARAALPAILQNSPIVATQAEALADERSVVAAVIAADGSLEADATESLFPSLTRQSFPLPPDANDSVASAFDNPTSRDQASVAASAFAVLGEGRFAALDGTPPAEPAARAARARIALAVLVSVAFAAIALWFCAPKPRDAASSAAATAAAAPAAEAGLAGASSGS